MQGKISKEELFHSGLLEKYVLGVCNPDEKAEVERWIAQDSEIHQLIRKLRNSVLCYCSSCKDDKVKSLLHKQHAPIEPECHEASHNAKMVCLSEQKSSLLSQWYTNLKKALRGFPKTVGD